MSLQRSIVPAVLLALTAASHALSIQLDYSFDAANGNFFGLTPSAKAALEAAAADLSAAILPTLNGVTTDVFTATNGGTNATFDWKLTFTNPSTGATETLNTFALPTDTYRIYVGMRPLSGGTLGQGGSGGAGFALAGSGFENQWIGAVDAAEAASNVVMMRGGGPVIGSLSGSSTFGSTTAHYALQYGAMIGNLWFDSDSDDIGGADNEVTLANYWHFNHTTPVANSKNDFYSVALHEILHALGVGSSFSWNGLRSGTTWLGGEAIALNGGSGAGLLDGGGSHIASGKMSVRLSDGMMQEVAMDPTLTVGSRKSLTELDLAFLRDLGYETIPEPGAASLLVYGLTVYAARRRRGIRAA